MNKSRRMWMSWPRPSRANYQSITQISITKPQQSIVDTPTTMRDFQSISQQHQLLGLPYHNSPASLSDYLPIIQITVHWLYINRRPIAVPQTPTLGVQYHKTLLTYLIPKKTNPATSYNKPDAPLPVTLLFPEDRTTQPFFFLLAPHAIGIH